MNSQDPKSGDEAWGLVKSGAWTYQQYLSWCDKALSEWTKLRDAK
jgi:hypothetical protein